MKFNFVLFGILVLISGCSSTEGIGQRRPFIFDELIEEEQVELELYDRISNAKKRVYLKNFPSLNVNHSRNNPDLFIDLLSKKKRQGVDIKVIHQAKKRVYPLTKHLYMNGVKNVKQLDDSYDYGVVGEGAKYAIIDDLVMVIYDPDDFPRFIGLEVEKIDIREDFEYTWNFIIRSE